MNKRHTIGAWVQELPKRGRYTFTLDDVVAEFPEFSREHIHLELHRQAAKGKAQSMWRGFYAVVLDDYGFSGATKITTYSIDELLGTKLRALYQRRKGRDLFDLWAALETGTVDPERVLEAFRYYTNTYSGSHPSSEVFMENLSLKMEDDEFLGDINALIRAGVEYDCNGAYKVVCEQLITRI